MVVNKPYIHFKINNEPIEEVVDYNYTWATTVETNKGPINTPVYIENAAQAQSIFGIDMRPYFAQNPKSLIMIRVAQKTKDNTPAPGIFNFNLQEDIVIYRAGQQTITLVNKVKKDNDSPVTKEEYTVPVFYTYDEANKKYIPVIPHRNSNGDLIPESYIDTWHNNGRIITKEDVDKDAEKTEPLPETLPADKVPSDFKQNLVQSKIYDSSVVFPLLVPEEFRIRATTTETDATTHETKISKTALFNIRSRYDGVYNVSVSCYRSRNQPKDVELPGYTIAITDPTAGTLRINNAYDVHKIVNRINDRNLDVIAETTNAGEAIYAAMHSYPQAVDTTPVTIGDEHYNTFSVFDKNTKQKVNVHKVDVKLITSKSTDGMYIALKKDKNTEELTLLNTTEYKSLTSATVPEGVSETEYTNIKNTYELFNYNINLEDIGMGSLTGGNNGEWDIATNRIPKQYQAEAHAEGLKVLRRIRLAGIFCMYGEDAIINEYLRHGINKDEPEKGMNNNETCKWRTILVGANQYDRSDLTSLASKAASLNNQYVLFLGQGLIDAGFTGLAATLSTHEKQNNGVISDHHLLPYECTQYIAGLRSKLNYGESIFGGQGRKRIRSVSGNAADLQIAPLLDYDDEYVWEPNYYIRLNEAGVLTFTDEYGNITLTDGVTTMQNRNEEDEEGVMNILKYAQNAVYDVCLPYIGRNIDADIENSITTAIEKKLEEMKSVDQTLVDTEEYPAYTVSVSLNSRRNQLLGRIYIYLTICPVHAVRQIEVEMTVQ